MKAPPPERQGLHREGGTLQRSRDQEELAATLVWFTGLSGAGKSTLARAVAQALRGKGLRVQVLDADEVRPNLAPDLGFSPADRTENLRRLRYVADLFLQHGMIVLVAAVSPYRADRDQARSQARRFVEVYVDAAVETCRARDPRGLYRRFRKGEVHGLSGLDFPYEPPVAPEVHCRTESETVEDCTRHIVEFVLAP